MMEDGSVGGVRGGGLGVRLLPPGSDITDDDALPFPLLGPGPDPDHHPLSPRKPLHWAVAGLILFGFSAPAALVTVPFAMGAAGFVLGSAALLTLTAASAGGALMLLEIYVAHPWSQNLPELGEAAMVRTVARSLACLPCVWDGRHSFPFIHFYFTTTPSDFSGRAGRGSARRLSARC